MDANAAAAQAARAAAPGGEERTLAGLVRYYLKLGSAGFGGPIALVGYMHRDLVEDREWFTEAEFQQGLAVAQTMPGPLAAQLAMWFGYLHAGARGAVAVSVPFVLPPFVIVTAVAALYARYQGLDLVHRVFLGVGPAVVAIIAIAAFKLARSTNKTDPALWTIALVLYALTAIAGAEIAWAFLLAGALGAVYYGGGLPHRGLASTSPVALIAAVKGLAWTGAAVPVGSLGWFFFKAGAFTFGSGLAIVPFLHQALVDEHGWVTQQQFVDAVAMGLISPGPVVIMATFAGYLAFGLVGATVATACVFLPALLLVILPGPLIRRHENHPRLQGFIKGATAAAAGAIAGAAFVIARDIIASRSSILICLAALALLMQPKVKVPEPALVATAALLGLVAFP